MIASIAHLNLSLLIADTLEASHEKALGVDMSTLNPVLQQSLQKALQAYVHTYGGESVAEVRAIAGSLLSVKAKAGEIMAQGMEMEAWVDQVMDGFDPVRLTEQAWDAGEAAIAAQAKKWREKLEVKVRATLDATIQNYAPDLTTTQIEHLIATILPIVEDTEITRDEAQRLIQAIGSQFDWQSAMSRVLDPKWVMLAEKTMQCLRQRDAEESVKDVMNAYVQKFKPSLVDIGEDLVGQAVTAVFNSKVQLDLDLDLDAETQRLMVKQVYLKFKLMEASPPPSKTALAIAQQVHTEVARYRQAQGLDEPQYLPPVSRTDQAEGSSVLGGEMSVGIEMRPSRSGRRPPSPDRGDT